MVTATVQTKAQIISEFEKYLSEHSRYYSEWYVGIASDPQARLFNDHNVNMYFDLYRYLPCNNQHEARDIEQYFIGKGCKGGPGGGDTSTKYVYVYKISSHTNP